MSTNPIKLSRAEAAVELLQRKEARAALLPFIRYVMPTYAVNWHHAAICSVLDSFARGETNRVMIFTPPQVGKSEISSRKLPAYILGRNPDARVIAASHTASLVREMNRHVQRCMDTREYTNLFPDTKLNPRNIRTVAGSYLRNNDVFEIVNRHGSYKCVGVGGHITGNPCDFALIDDPVHGIMAAYSKTIRNSTYEWYVSDLETRLHDKSAVLLLMTRWHPDDLAGRLLSIDGDAADGGKWTVIRLPALCVDPTAPFEIRQVGESIWPERFPVELYERRRRLNSHQFEATYQQNPRPQEGRLFTDAHFCEELPTEGAISVGLDLAYTKTSRSDYTAYVVRRRVDHKTYIIEAGRWRERIEETIRRLAALQRRFPVAFAVEDNGPQTAIADTLESAGIRITRHQPVGDKYARAQEFAAAWNRGDVLVPMPKHRDDGMPVYAWLDEYVAEVCEFTGVNDTNDDQVDASVIGYDDTAPNVPNVRRLRMEPSPNINHDRHWRNVPRP